MKKALDLILILLLVFVFQNCAEEEENMRPQKVKFTCNFKSTDTAKVRSGVLPEGTILQISIQTQTGTQVLTDHSINLLSFGDSFITEPIELEPGNYKIVDFLLVHDTRVLYAVPHAGAPLGSAVNMPLEFNFSVTKNNQSNVAMEVLNINGRTAEDFGYASFGVEIVNTFELSVFTASEQAQFTGATAYILYDADTVQEFVITPAVNRITFEGDEENSYTLEIVKDGYGRYTREIIPASLATELNNRPMNVVLEPALTMHGRATASNTFAFTIQSNTGGDVLINWGDGTTSSHELDFTSKSHTYATGGSYFITVTGDISVINYFSSYYGDAVLDQINLEHLAELKDMRCALTESPTSIDLSHNSKLEYLDVGAARQLEHIDLPTAHNISGLNINGPNNLTIDAVNYIIENIHTNAVNKNILDGFFNLKKSFYESDSPMLGPPSSESITKLQTLRDTYGWNIVPEPFNDAFPS